MNLWILQFSIILTTEQQKISWFRGSQVIAGFAYFLLTLVGLASLYPSFQLCWKNVISELEHQGSNNGIWKLISFIKLNNLSWSCFPPASHRIHWVLMLLFIIKICGFRVACVLKYCSLWFFIPYEASHFLIEGGHSFFLLWCSKAYILHISQCRVLFAFELTCK